MKSYFAYIPDAKRQPHPPKPERIATVPLYGPPEKGSKLIGYFAPDGRTVYTRHMTVSLAEVNNGAVPHSMVALGVHANKAHQRRLEAVSRQGL